MATNGSTNGTTNGSYTNGTGHKTTMHRLIAEHGSVLMPGVQDALSAAVVEKTGFHAAFVSGYSVSAAMLGLPDFGLLTYVLYTWFSYYYHCLCMLLCVYIIVFHFIYVCIYNNIYKLQ